MALFRRKKSSSSLPGITGPVRIAPSPRDFGIVRSGDVVVLSVSDLDEDAAQQLVEKQIAGVVNTVPSYSGTYPSRGPAILVDADVPVIDSTGGGLVDLVRNGEILRLHDGGVFRGDELLAQGVSLSATHVAAQLEDSTSGMATRLDSIALNATERLRREQPMYIEGAKIPRLSQPVEGRPVVVVSDTFDAAADLKRIRRFIQDNDPVLIGVAGGLEVLSKAGFTPDVAVGSADEISSAAVSAATEIVVVAADGRIPIPERFEKSGRKPLVFPATGPVRDLAILLADHHDPAVIVEVGGAPSLAEYLDRDPVEIGSNFITRLRTATSVVDARVVHHFQVQRLGWFTPTLLLIAALIALVVAVGVTPFGEPYADRVVDAVSDFFSWIKGLIS